MFQRLKTWFSSAPKSDNGVRIDLARVLGSSLLVAAAISVVAIVAVFVTRASNWERLVRDALSVLLISLILWVFLRRGYERLVTYGVVIAFAAFAAFSAFTGIGVRGTSYGMLLLVIMVTALFLHRRAAYGMAVISSLIGLGLIWANWAGLMPNTDRPLSEVASWLIQTAYFFIAAVILDIVLRQIDRAFAQAQHELEERKQTEESLRDSEQRFRRFFHTSPAAMMIISDHGIVDANEAFLRMIRYTVKEIVGQTVQTLDLLPLREDYDRINAALAQSDTSTIQNLELTFRQKTGEIRHAIAATELIKLEGQVQYIVTAFDITERRLAEEKILEMNAKLEQRVFERTAELAAREERYRLITQVSSDYIFSSEVDKEGKVSHNWVAGAFEKIMGCTFEEYIAAGGWPSVLYYQDMERDRQDMAALHENRPVTTEVRIKTQTGVLRWVCVDAHPVWDDQENRLKGIYGAVRDITERIQAEDALREAELRYRTLVEQTSVVIYRDAVDSDSSALYISPQIETLLGYTPEEWTNDATFWQTLLHPDDRERILEAVDIHFSQGQDFTSDYRMQARDGRWVWVRDEAVVVKDRAGTPLFVQGVLMDITEQKLAEMRERAVTEGLRAVVGIADELILIPDLDTFYRRAVELAREKLELERCSLFLFDPTLTYQIGTYGTTDEGNTSDERFLKLELKDQVASRLLSGERSVLIVDADYVAWDDVDLSRNVGTGWIATTLIRSSTQPMGVFSNDAALSQSPVNETQQEMVVVYCSILGNIIERKRAEEALREAELRYRTLVEQTSVVIYRDNPDIKGTSQYISPRIESLLGYTIEEWLSDPEIWHHSLHPDDRERAQADIQRYVTEKSTYLGEYRLRAKDGRWVWVRDEAVVVTDEEGSPRYVQGVLIDVTEQKQAEARAQNISERLRAVLEIADELILAPDLDTIYRRAVELARQKLGIERCGLFLFDESLTNQIGTFGTDEHGDTTDERGITREISGWAVNALLAKGERSWIIFDDQLSYWGEDEQQLVVGRGWIASTIIRSTTQPIGVFYNDTAISNRPMNETQQEILTVYCSLLGNIIERKQFEQHLKEYAVQLLTLYELSREIVSSLDLEQVCVAAHRAVENLMPTDAFFISLVDEGQTFLEDVYLFDGGKRWSNETVPLCQPGITTHVFQTGETLWIRDDADGVSEAIGRTLFGTEKATRSVLISPLKLGGKVIGLISAQHYNPHIYTSEHVQILETLGNQIAIAIEHARLVQSLRIQAAALDAAANAIVITNQQGNIQWVNPAFTRLTGYSPKEVISKKPNILKSDMHDSHFYKNLWETILAGDPWHGEITNRRKDGNLYVEEMVITPVRNEQGDIFRFIAIKQDITTRKQAEDRDKRRRILLEKVIELGKAVTVETDLRACLRQIHQSVQKGLNFDRVGIFLYEEHTGLIRGMFGTSRSGEIEDNSWYTQVAAESEAWREALSQPSGMTFIQDYDKVYQIPPENEMFGVKEHISLAAWAGGNPVALIAVDNLLSQRSITPEDLEALQLFAGYAGLAIENARWNAELEQRVAERTAELQIANQELQAFTYTIAHDLRAPARAMIGFSGLLEEMLTEQVVLDPISQNYLTRVHNGAKRMGQMIDELLEYTRLGRMQMYPQPVNMNNLIRQVIQRNKPEIKERRVEIITNDLPPCEGDPDLLEKVWDQLVSNALKFTRTRSEPVIEIGAELDHKTPHYFVRDNGIGFDMQYAPKLFGVFSRLHIEDEYEGTGMGLAMSARIMEQHGGRIWAESTEGEGATFFFALKSKDS